MTNQPLRLWKVTGTRSNQWPPSKFIRAANINEAIRKASKGKDFILVVSACLIDEVSEEHE